MANRYSYIKQVKSSTDKKIYATVRYPSIPPSLDDLYVLCNATDRYDKLAQDYYNDPTLWWVIASANDGVACDSLFPPTGSYVRIPSNHVETVREFIKLNDQAPTLTDEASINLASSNNSGGSSGY
tara:strand:+ start:252 stop:629 length:378 start_codon:yes stop_codon:yes gene_type:complete